MLDFEQYKLAILRITPNYNPAREPRKCFEEPGQGNYFIWFGVYTLLLPYFKLFQAKGVKKFHTALYQKQCGKVVGLVGLEPMTFTMST